MVWRQPLHFGGEGAVFWMWVTAFIGMSSAFAESTLAQVFKIQDKDGSFRGGPAYYITRFKITLFSGSICRITYFLLLVCI